MPKFIALEVGLSRSPPVLDEAEKVLNAMTNEVYGRIYESGEIWLPGSCRSLVRLFTRSSLLVVKMTFTGEQ